MPIMTGITNPKEPLIAEELNSNYFEIVAGQVQTKVFNSVVVTTTDSIDYVVAPSDRYVIVDAGTTNTKNVVFPAAAAFPNRAITVRGPITLTGRIVTVKTAAGTELTSPGGQLNTTRVTWDSIVIDDRAVSEATWISTGSLWKLINWTERKFYATANYTAPSNASTFLSTGGVAPAAGQPYQIPAGVTSWVAVDGNYTATIKLPTTNNATGRFSAYASNSASFDTIIDKSGTDLPFSAWIQSPLQSMHFEWSNGLWRWVPAPEANAPSVVKNTNTALSGGYTVPPQTVVNGVTTYTNLVTIPQSTPITIPAPANYPKNTELYLKTTGAWTGSIVITPAGGQIDQAATFTLSKPSATLKPSVTVMHDGFNWYVV